MDAFVLWSTVSFLVPEPVSLSRARTMRYDNTPGHLKFAKHAVMKVIAKNVGGREDLWEAEVRKNEIPSCSITVRNQLYM